MRAVVVVVLLGACGRVGFDPVARASDSGTIITDTRPDTAVACTLGPFGTPQTFAILNSTAIDWGPHLSSDGLELVFSSNRGGSDQLYTAKRATPADAWSAAVLTMPPTGVVDDPELSTDRLSLYYGAGVGHATRATIADAWVVQGQEAFAHSGFSVDGGPWISPDRLTLVFTGTDTATDMKWHEYQTTRAAPGDAWGAAAPVLLEHTTDGEAYGSMTGDQLEIIFETETTSQLFHATRTSVTSAFDAAVGVTELNQPAYLFGDPDLSEDGKTLWFASTRPGGVGDYDLWTATRSCL